VAYVDAIARSGYIVFKPDLRGHGNSEGGDSVGDVVYGTPAAEEEPVDQMMQNGYNCWIWV